MGTACSKNHEVVIERRRSVRAAGLEPRRLGPARMAAVRHIAPTPSTTTDAAKVTQDDTNEWVLKKTLSFPGDLREAIVLKEVYGEVAWGGILLPGQTGTGWVGYAYRFGSDPYSAISDLAVQAHTESNLACNGEVYTPGRLTMTVVGARGRSLDVRFYLKSRTDFA